MIKNNNSISWHLAKSEIGMSVFDAVQASNLLIQFINSSEYTKAEHQNYFELRGEYEFSKLEKSEVSNRLVMGLPTSVFESLLVEKVNASIYLTGNNKIDLFFNTNEECQLIFNSIDTTYCITIASKFFEKLSSYAVLLMKYLDIFSERKNIVDEELDHIIYTLRRIAVPEHELTIDRSKITIYSNRPEQTPKEVFALNAFLISSFIQFVVLHEYEHLNDKGGNDAELRCDTKAMNKIIGDNINTKKFYRECQIPNLLIKHVKSKMIRIFGPIIYLQILAFHRKALGQEKESNLISERIKSIADLICDLEFDFASNQEVNNALVLSCAIFELINMTEYKDGILKRRKNYSDENVKIGRAARTGRWDSKKRYRIRFGYTMLEGNLHGWVANGSNSWNYTR